MEIEWRCIERWR